MTRQSYVQKIILGLLFLGSTMSDLYAQDPRFAQFYAAPDQLNPALNVVYDGRMRFIANYRDQWSSVLNDVPFRTVAAHWDYRMNVGKNDYLSMGFGGLHDQGGTSRLQQVKGQLNVAFMKYLGGNRKRDFYLVAGAQTGVGQHSIDWSDLWFSQQYDGLNDVVNFDAASGEIERQSGKVYPDFSAGMLWYVLGEAYSFYAGGAIYHLNQPNISVLANGNDPLMRRYVAHLGGEVSINKNLSLLPATALFVQGPSVDFNVGTNFRYTSGDINDLALRIGGWLHLTDRVNANYSIEAFTITSMLEMKTWTLGLSYDINTSQLTAVSNARGAFEASFTYILPEKGRRQKVICPKF
ncbi:MAG: PorP/SprF family type IX secretion system membrane protein [Bacteroidota bacterium]